jgi:transposase
MSSDAEQLPSDPDTLRRMVIAERAARAASEAELAAAKAGLQAKALEIEKLERFPIRLRSQRC